MDWIYLLNQIASIKEEISSLMLLSTEARVDKFFMMLTLIGLGSNFRTFREQILSSPVIPSFDEVIARLLRVSSTLTQTPPPDSIGGSSVLVSSINS